MNEHLYRELAPLWDVLSPPESHADEAMGLVEIATAALGRAPTSWLELGSGAGHHAMHLPPMHTVLVDASEAMLDLSRAHNPTATHVCADMRTLKLVETFDVVLLHDAVMYLTTLDDLRATFAAAARHLQPGGVLVVVPDVVREDFVETTQHGGGERAGLAAQILEWHWDPDPSDCTYRAEFTVLIRENGEVRVEHETHILGLFTRAELFGSMTHVSLRPTEADVMAAMRVGEVFLGQKP